MKLFILVAIATRDFYEIEFLEQCLVELDTMTIMSNFTNFEQDAVHRKG